MNRIVCLLVALPLLSPALAHAQSAVDERAIITAVSALDAALDAKDWKGVRALLLDEVSVALPEEETTTLAADELVARWQTTLHDGKSSFHLRGGERVTFDGADSAVLRSKAQLWQHLPGTAGDDHYERLADYHHELDRANDGNWRVRHYGYVTRLEYGNLAVLAHRLPEPPPTEKAGIEAEKPAKAEGEPADDVEADENEPTADDAAPREEPTADDSAPRDESPADAADEGTDDAAGKNDAPADAN